MQINQVPQYLTPTGLVWDGYSTEVYVPAGYGSSGTYKQAHYVQVDVLTCNICWATVGVKNTPSHTAWHLNQTDLIKALISEVMKPANATLDNIETMLKKIEPGS